MRVAQEVIPPPSGWPPKASSLGNTLPQDLPQAEPRVFGRQRIFWCS
jgi:hypothetical protein